MSRFRHPWAYLLFLGCLFFLYTHNLDFPKTEYFDEVYHVKTAREFVLQSGNTENTHPPLGKWIISASMMLLGDSSFAWRLPSVLAGLGCLYFFFLLARYFLEEELFAAMAVVFLSFDGSFITQARIGMLNSVMLLGMLAMLWFWIRALEEPEKKWLNLVLSAVCLGLAAATRWIGLGILIPAFLVLCLYFSETWRDIPRLIRIALVFVCVVPVVYFAGHLVLLGIPGYQTFGSLFRYQKNMWNYHHMLTAGHPYGSAWWGWPMMARPIWYFFENRNGWINGILCVSNPAVIWAFFPAMGYALSIFSKGKNRALSFLIGSLLSQWLPWAFIGRVKFFHYFYPAMPFLVLIVVYYLKDLWKGGPRGKWLVAAYFVLVLAQLAYWYPLWIGETIPQKWYEAHLWFRSWI